MRNFEGLGTALITPFRGGSVDFQNLAQLVERQIAASVDYLVVLGTTGEASTLSDDEIHAVVGRVIDVNAGRLPVVLGTFGGNNTRTVIQKMEAWSMEGIDALLSVTPCYNRPSQSGMIAHYQALDRVARRPIIMYNVPSRTGVNTTALTVEQIASSCPNIVGIKEASGDLFQGAQMIRDCPQDFLIASGDDQTALPLMSLGSDGVISVISNAYPEELSAMVKFALEGNYDKASEIHGLLLDVHYYLYAQSNPAGIKTCMAMMDLCTDEVRLPLVSLATDLRGGLAEVMKKIGEVK